MGGKGKQAVHNEYCYIFCLSIGSICQAQNEAQWKFEKVKY